MRSPISTLIKHRTALVIAINLKLKFSSRPFRLDGSSRISDFSLLARENEKISLNGEFFSHHTHTADTHEKARESASGFFSFGKIDSDDERTKLVGSSCAFRKLSAAQGYGGGARERVSGTKQSARSCVW
jgi:hypothetical protein